MKSGLEGLEETVFPLVVKPGRYLAPGSFRPGTDFDAASLRLLVLACEPLEAAVADSGFQSWILEARRLDAGGDPGVAADLSGPPEADLVRQLRDEAMPAFSFIHRRSLAEFDLLVLYSSSVTGVSRGLACLSLAGIPIRAEDRGSNHPIVLLAGDAAWYPETTRSFLDGFLLGDPELLLPEVAAAAGEAGARVPGVQQAAMSRDRRRVLFRFSEVEGVLVPTFTGPDSASDPERVPAPRWLESLPAQEGRPCLPLVESRLEGVFLEVARAAGPECPVSPPRRLRARPVDDILQGAEWALGSTGEGMLVLGGLVAGRHPDLARALESLHLRFAPSGVHVRVTEVDPAGFSAASARELQKSHLGDLVFAPVACSEELRARGGRALTRAALQETVELALRGQWAGVRLRFVLGLPGETPKDHEEAMELLAELARDRKGPRRPRIGVETIPFVAVRGTPWEDEPGPSASVWAGWTASWRARLARSKVRLTVSTPAPAIIESALRRGGERAAPVLPELAAFWEKLPPDPEGAARAWEDLRAHVAPVLDEPACGSPRRAPGPAGEFESGRAETVWGAAGGGLPESRPLPLGDEGGRRPRRGTRARDVRRAERFRLRAAKAEPVRFISHLDVTRAFLRGFRMSQLPLAVSGGKDRRPKVAFGPPLPLGMTSGMEFLDVAFAKEVPESFVRSLNECLPEGLAVTASAPIRVEPASLSSAIQIASYEVTFPDKLIEHQLDGIAFEELKARLVERTAAALAASEFPVTKGRGNEQKTFNARPSLLRAEVVRDDGGRPAIKLGLTLNRPDSARPELWTAALIDWTDFDERLLRVHRSGLFIPGRQAWLDPLDVVASGFEWWRQPVRGGTVL